MQTKISYFLFFFSISAFNYYVVFLNFLKHLNKQTFEKPNRFMNYNIFLEW